MMPAQLARAKRLWVSRHARMMPKAASWIGASDDARTAVSRFPIDPMDEMKLVN